ncbi:MAG: substrate-binding domain-containing protein [Chloroflexi bacterium]|nr:substrate-binding domain-containing protein [Chloroflexota bacterium]
MKKNLFVLMAVLVLASMILSACGGASTPAAEAPAAEKPMKIAFFVSDMSNVFHQMQATEAQKYAKEKYGAEVFIFDGKSDGAVMTQNVDQVVAQGMDAATLHIWDAEAAKPGVQAALDKGIIMTSFFSPLADTGIPTARSDEAGVSFAMGVEMAKQWKEAHPDKPIVMVQLGWPNHTEVKSGRTDPFVKGVLSVDPDATDLGCQDASKGPDAAKQIITDLMTTHPEVNLIYSEASNLTIGTMAALEQAGRGKMDNGKPLTEIVASVDFDEVEMKSVYDPNSSLKLSMGLPPVETARGRIDLIMDVKAGKVKPTSQPAEEFFYKAYTISFWTMPGADAAKWLNDQFGTNVSAPEAPAVVEAPAAREIVMPGDRFFGEGVTVTSDGTFYAGSMEEGTIVKAAPGSDEAEPFIAAGENGLVSVLGLYADEASNTLWACSSDAGNSKLKGTAPVGVKAFDLKTGAVKGSYDFPGGGFCNDLTVDAEGNVYATDSWTPRILRLTAGSKALEEWINDPQFGAEQWSLNGLDFDQANGVIYVLNQRLGKLFRVVVEADGSAGAVTLIETSQELRRPDGLKLIGPNTLVTVEGGAGAVAVITLDGDKGEVRRIEAGLDGVATFAYYDGSAWVVENQGDHFWDPTNAGPDATKPFRIVEVLLD